MQRILMMVGRADPRVNNKQEEKPYPKHGACGIFFSFDVLQWRKKMGGGETWSRLKTRTWFELPFSVCVLVCKPFCLTFCSFFECSVVFQTALWNEELINFSLLIPEINIWTFFKIYEIQTEFFMIFFLILIEFMLHLLFYSFWGKNKMPCSAQVPLPWDIHTLSAAICCEILGYMFSKSNFKGCDSGMRGKDKCRKQSVLLREAKTEEVFHSHSG